MVTEIEHLPEVDSRPSLGVLFDLVAVELADLAPGVEDADEGRVVKVRPLLDREHQRVFRKLDRSLGERHVPGSVGSK